jgi:hypothetical protein
MTLEVQIVDGGRVLLRAPIQGVSSSGDRLSFDLDDELIGRLVSMHAVAANERRMRMMLELTRKGELQFSDLLEIAENPKLVTDCMRPLLESGLVEHEKWGSSYRTTAAGEALAAVMTVGMASMIEFFEEEGDDENE